MKHILHTCTYRAKVTHLDDLLAVSMDTVVVWTVGWMVTNVLCFWSFSKNFAENRSIKTINIRLKTKIGQNAPKKVKFNAICTGLSQDLSILFVKRLLLSLSLKVKSCKYEIQMAPPVARIITGNWHATEGTYCVNLFNLYMLFSFFFAELNCMRKLIVTKIRYFSFNWRWR